MVHAPQRTQVSPVKIQSIVLLECRFNFSRISGVGALLPRSYLDSWVWLIPRISANSACFRSNPRISRIRRPIAFKSSRTSS